MSPTKSRGRAGWSLGASAALALACAVAMMTAGTSHSDLEIYRFGVDTLWSGGDLYGALPLSDAGIPLLFIYPPFAALVLTPLAMVPWTGAVLLLFALSLAALGITFYAIARTLWPSGDRRKALFVASLAITPALFLEPVRQTLGFGQINLLLMGLVAADCLLARGRYRGIGVGLAAAIKLTPMAFLLFFLVRKDFRGALTAVGTFVAASAVAFAVAPEASARYWFGGLAGASGISGTSFHTNQTLQAVLARFGVESAAKPLWMALTGVLLVLVTVTMYRSAPVRALLLNATFALLISPTSWSHHWVWIAPALFTTAACAVLHRQDRRRAAAWIAVTGVVATIFVAAPFRYFPAFDRPGQTWTTTQQWLGNCYVLAGLVFLAVAGALSLRKRG
ncbi:glycosyltransferase 87 family protein [Amycolatopsis sp. EV170708-02-1]|uniref:glycosyltransferase 87 family protein n=1 Tax=Amycolatopsis sp. EV170708-02-1 TaxID=2919322 RepID=UPI001F0CC0F5|nr:glycosyltransferase 87 family protein [Amycolatopsis sp. EV170708-02-1]UMP01460.1 glycosyltransferase 87 family protein [Amycolatopsis sp. EV170708-02-1]